MGYFDDNFEEQMAREAEEEGRWKLRRRLTPRPMWWSSLLRTRDRIRRRMRAMALMPETRARTRRSTQRPTRKTMTANEQGWREFGAMIGCLGARRLVLMTLEMPWLISRFE
jgi:hypothetical protein